MNLRGARQAPPHGPGEDPAAAAGGDVDRPTPADPAVAAVRRPSIRSECLLAGVGAVLLAVLMTWPTLRHPAGAIPQDTGDPTLQAWQMAWSGHILTTDPTALWQSNASYPERYAFGFADTLLGYAPLGMIGHGPTDAVVRYNVVYVLLHALAFFGAYVLVRQLGAGRAGSALAGAAFAYAPWRLAQAGHMQVLSTGGIALALAMLARGHGLSLRHGYRPGRAHAGWALAGWLVAAWQITLGFGIGLPFVYVLVGAVLVVGGRRLLLTCLRRARAPFPARVAAADAAGGLVFAGVGLFMAFPYFQVAEIYPQARQSETEVAAFSPGVEGFLIAPAESWLWGDAHAAARSTLGWPTESTLLPGFLLIALAAVGLFFSVWTARQRLYLFAGTVLTVVLGMGAHFFGGRPGYLTLYDVLPGWDGLRTPGRLVLWTTLLLGVLAAGAVSATAPGGVRTARARLAVAVPCALVLLEGANTTPHPAVPAQPAALRTAAGPLLVLPSGYVTDEQVMLWSTDRFQPVVNGVSSFTLPRREQIRALSRSFPDAASVAALRGLGVRTVVVLRDRAAGTPWQHAADAPVAGLGVAREDRGEAVLFTLCGPGPCPPP
jgi:hypothetical protein